MIKYLLALALLASGCQSRYSRECREYLYPVVKVMAGSTAGSGTMLGDAYVLTCYHVLSMGDQWCDTHGIKCPAAVYEVMIYEWELDRIVERVRVRADVVECDVVNDLVLLQMKEDLETPYSKPTATVKIATEEEFAELKLLGHSQVRASGCFFGDEPTCTVGEISTFHDVVGSHEYFAGTAMVSPGVSGGGVFVEIGCEVVLVGVPAMRHQWAPHINWFIPAKVIREFLKEGGFTKFLRE